MLRAPHPLLLALSFLAAACGSDPASSPADGGGARDATSLVDAAAPGADGGGEITDAGPLGEDATVGGPDAAPASDASIPTGPHATPGVCVPDPDGTGNSKNIGAYCTNGGGQCSGYTFARFCSIELDPEGGNFCMHIGCSEHDACGEEACCTGRAGNPIHACVPKGCVAPDAGSACPPIP